MTATTATRGAGSAVPEPSTPSDRAADLLGGVVSWAVGGLAWWTALFHLALPLGWHRDLVGALWVAGLAGALAVTWGLRRRHGVDDAAPRWHPVLMADRRWLAVLAAIAAAAAVLSATRWPEERPAWWLFWALVVTTTAGGVALVLRAGPAPARSAERTEPDELLGARPVTVPALVLVVALAVLAAAGSALTQRPDADDVFLVNRTTYVAEHAGPLPVRDTLFSDEVFAVTRPDAVPTSFEALVGVGAAWTGLNGATATYLLAGPLAAALAVLALWRLLRTLGAVAPALATAAACAFLLLDGGGHHSFGNFHFARAWQGKVVFLIVVLPAIWHHGLRWARDGRRRDLALLAAANLAGIGLTTTAAFVAPAATVLVVVAGGWASAAWGRLAVGAVASAPAVLAAIAFTVLPRQDTAVSERLGELGAPVLAWIPPWFTLTDGIEAGRQWHRIFEDGMGLLVPVAAVLLAWVVVVDRAARLALLLAPLVLFGFFYGPGTFDAIAELSGVRSILWRSGWLLPVPAAVGLVCTAPLLLPASARRTTLAVAAPVVVLGAMALGSTWVLDEGNRGMRIGAPAWDVDPADRAAAQRLIDLTPPGGTIVAPETIGGVVAIQTTEVRAVNPRGQYMRGTHVVPEFLAEERRIASESMVLGLPPEGAEAVRSALVALDAETACVSSALGAPDVEAILGELGYEPAGADERCRFWVAL